MDLMKLIKLGTSLYSQVYLGLFMYGSDVCGTGGGRCELLVTIGTGIGLQMLMLKSFQKWFQVPHLFSCVHNSVPRQILGGYKSGATMGTGIILGSRQL